MERGRLPCKNDSANKHSRRSARDGAILSYWDNQRVVPTKVNGKITYTVISTTAPSGEYDGRGRRMRHQELFPSSITRNDTLISHLQCQTVYGNSAVDEMFHHSTADIADSRSHGNDSGKYTCKPVNGSNSVDGLSVINLAQSCEQQLVISEKPSTTVDNGGTAISNSNISHHRRTSCTHEQSAVKVCQRRISGEHGQEASSGLLDSATATSYVLDDCDSSRKHTNLRFYLNEIKSEPAGEKIENMLRYWYGNYELLENNHNYIQWLFPTKSLGVNRHAEPLTEDEAKIMRTKQTVKVRFIQAYKMMLDFYGLKLSNVEKGHVVHAANWKERFHHLKWWNHGLVVKARDSYLGNSGCMSAFSNGNTSTKNSSNALEKLLFYRSQHNYQRITRILESTGMLGAAYLQVPLVSALIDEIFLHKTLPNAASSCRNYWIPAVLDEKDRQMLFEAINSL